MNPNYENIEPLVNYIRANHIKTPLKLEIGLDKVSSDGMTRYFTTKINGDDVTGMVAKALDNKISKAKDTPFKMIVHGCGMDMGFAVQYQLYKEFASADLGNMIDRNNYVWLGKIENGKYPYDNKYNFTGFDKMLREFDENGKYAGDSYEEFGKNTVDNLRMLKLVDYGFSKEQELAQKYTYLSDCLSTEQFKSLCEACDYDEDTLEDFNNQVKDYYAGKTVSSIFYDALEDNRVEEYIKEYDKFYHGLSDDIDIYNTHNDKDIEMC